MIKKTKIALMSLLCAGYCIAAGAGAVSSNVQAIAATPNFQVDNGAAVRLTAEDTDFGIRFSATVGEVVDGAKYNMLILPIELVNYYNADTTEGKADIVTYMKALASANGGKLSIVEDCVVRTDGKIYGSIVDVQWNNLNRDFVGVAYYEKDGKVTVAEMAAENGERSVADVANEAINSGKYDGNDEVSVANKSILIDKVRKGEKQAAGQASDATYIYEDFRYAFGDVAKNDASEVTKTISFSDIDIGFASRWGYPCIVTTEGNRGLQFKRQNDAYDVLTLGFGTVNAGSYKLSFKMSENAIGELINPSNPEKGKIDYNNWKLMGWNGSAYGNDLGLLYSKYYVGNNTFEYYFNQAEEGEFKIALAGLDRAGTGFTGQGQILLDNICLEPVEELPTVEKKLNVFTSANFDDMPSPYIPLSNYGIYTRSNMTPTVNMAENNSLTVNSSAYGATVFYVGDLTPGQYKLKFNATLGNNFPAILGGATMTMASNGSISYANDVYFNYVGKNLASGERVQKLADYYPNSNGEYELLFTVTDNIPNFALYLANNVNQASSMTLDNVSFERDAIDYTKGYTLDFENGKSFNWVYNKDLVGLNYSIDNTKYDAKIDMLGFVTTNNLLRANETTNAIEVVDNVEINGQTSKALAVNNNLGWSSFFAISVGYLTAGTYTIEVDLSATSNGYSRGTFSYMLNGTKTDFSTKYTTAGRYTFTFTIATAGEVFFRYTDPNTNVNKSVNYVDNLTITKTA